MKIKFIKKKLYMYNNKNNDDVLSIEYNVPYFFINFSQNKNKQRETTVRSCQSEAKGNLTKRAALDCH